MDPIHDRIQYRIVPLCATSSTDDCRDYLMLSMRDGFCDVHNVLNVFPSNLYSNLLAKLDDCKYHCECLCNV